MALPKVQVGKKSEGVRNASLVPRVLKGVQSLLKESVRPDVGSFAYRDYPEIRGYDSNLRPIPGLE
jgi:hypothetical protein